MKIATVDSGCSILDEHFKPTSILSTAALIVDQPYETPTQIEVRPGDYPLTDANVLIYELKLCQNLLEKEEKVDYVHLDLTLGGTNLLDVTDEFLFQFPLSPMGRNVLHAILPELRNLATQIDETHHIPVLAMGKRSLPVRLAELYATAYGVQRAFERARTSESPICVGLPPKVLASFDEADVVHISSTEPMEHALRAQALVETAVSVEPFMNPMTRGFQVLKLAAKPHA